MDAPVYKKLTDIEKVSQKENPFHTAEGQDVVSVSEGFWARMGRLGRWRSKAYDGFDIPTTNVTGNTIWYAQVVSPNIGTIMYPKRAIISSNIDAELVVQVLTGTLDIDTVYHVGWVKAGTPFIVDFDGEVFCTESGSLSLGIKSNVGGKFYGSYMCLEVSDNA